MGLLRRRKKDPDPDDIYQQNVALTEQGNVGPQDYINALGSTSLMIQDSNELELLKSSRKLRNLIPAWSPLNQLTNIDSREARIRRLKYKILLLKMKAYMNSKEYSSGGSVLISSFELRSRSITSDAEGGWKGKMVTTQRREIRTEQVKKKRGLLG